MGWWWGRKVVGAWEWTGIGRGCRGLGDRGEGERETDREGEG